MLKKKFSVIAVALALSACHSISAIDRPDVNYQENWQQQAAFADAATLDKEWWQHFKSPELSRLIDEALKNSPDLEIAAQRVVQAELQMNSAGSSLFPSLSLSANTGETRSRSSGSSWNDSESSRVSLGANYEVDLWGRVSASIRSAEASFLAQRYDYEASRLSLLSGVANAWFQWLSLQQRVKTAEENIKIAQRLFQVVEARYRNGAATAADVSRQRVSLLNQETALQPLALQERQTRAALAILVGKEPYPFELSQEPLLELSIPEVAAGVPSELISRRPDLAASEAQLQAADANVKVARAALYPSLQLSASLGRSSNDLLSLSGSTDSIGVSAGLTQTIFDRGRLRNQVKTSESQRIALLEQYRKAIYTALYEVQDALDKTEVYKLQEEQLDAIAVETERTLRLTEVRYREGRDDLTTLLDAQRSLFQLQDQRVQMRQARLNAALDLYKALGGGWQQEKEE